MKISQNEVISLVLADFLQHYINPSNFAIELALMESTMSRFAYRPKPFFKKSTNGMWMIPSHLDESI